MRTIRMKHGGFHPRYRQDGQQWPPFNATISVGDEEAADLVTAGIAVYEEDDPDPVNEGFKTLNVMLPGYREPDPEPVNPFEDEDEDEDVEDERHENLAQEQGKRGTVKRPSTTAPKEAWVKYAVSQGASEKAALAKSKNALIEEYGASL